MKSERSRHLKRVERLVVKVGSSLLTSSDRRGVDRDFLRSLAREIKSLHRRGIQCLVVTSGAIAAGLFALGLKTRPKRIDKLQALAALGQSSLMHAYSETFRSSGLKVAQVLLTREDLSDPRRYGNARRTLKELFRHGIVPVVNENDTVAVEEIKFGDNDTLAALVVELAQAQMLVLLTDTDGFYEEDPRVNPKAKLLSNVHRLDGDLERRATSSRSVVGTGGMGTKVQAARRMMSAGIPTVIAKGSRIGTLTRILSGEEVGTFFFPSRRP